MLAFWILVIGLTAVKATNVEDERTIDKNEFEARTFEDIAFEDREVEDDGGSIDDIIIHAGQATGYAMDLSEKPLSDGTVLMEGDMLLTPQQVEEDKQAKREEKMGLEKRKGIKDSRYRWSNNILPYVIAYGTFSNGEMREINNAIADWNKYTCVRLQPRSNQRNYATLQNGGGCSSYVGMIGGNQPVSLARGCRIKRIILHELGHALGFQHEQCRYDRDNYLTVYLSNVQSSMRHNFDKYTTNDMTTHGVDYDYGSVMQYGETAFGGGRITIVTKDSRYQKLIGNSKGLSFADLKTMNMMYKCGAHCPGTCSSDGYMDKNCQCQCRSGANNFQSGTVPIKNCGSGTGGGSTGGGSTGGGSTGGGSTGGGSTGGGNCSDGDANCAAWASRGECTNNPDWMLENCKRSCNACSGGGGSCSDQSENCAYWAGAGECQKNADYMLDSCAKSCGSC